MTYLLVKRFSDFIFALIGLIISIPLIFIFSLLLVLTGEFSPIYSCYRVGHKGKLFRIYKLRTMRKTQPQSKPTRHFTCGDDNRITLLGKILRHSKLDELPQLFNILLGNLSFVGPRPQSIEIFDKYDDDTQTRLKSIKPGVTGIGSLFFRNENQLLTKVNPSKRDAFYDQQIVSSKGNLEVWYVENRSLWLDFKILCFTIIVLFYTRLTKLNYFFRGLSDLEIESSTKRYS